VQVLVSSVSDVLQHTRSGKLKPLAVTGTERSSFMPDVPTAIESGVKFESLSWIGLYAPRNTSPEVTDRLYQALTKVMKSESFKKSLTTVGYEQYPVMTPAQFGDYQRNDLVRWGKVIRDLKLQTQ
jgi:tripartite-type tricarboxylate transporter receptor subunit TctC